MEYPVQKSGPLPYVTYCLLHAVPVNPITNRRRGLDVQCRILGYLAYTSNLDERLVADMSEDLDVFVPSPR